MPECRFTSTALGALRLAQENAARLGHSYVGSEHLLLGLASQEYSAAARSLQSSGVDSRSLRSAISQLVGTGVPARSLHQGLTPKCCLAIQQAAAASRRLGQNAVSAEHLLLGLLQDRECAACRLMAEQGADLDQLSQGLAAFLGGEELPTRSVRPREPERSTDTRLLDQCARDLTRMAADGQLDPVIGREEELTRVIQILSRRTKNNPALIGEPGVGKTAIVEGVVIVARASPSTMAVFPTPGSPMRAGLFLVRRDRIWITRVSSSSRPITGSSCPSAAIRVKSRAHWSSRRVSVLRSGSRGRTERVGSSSPPRKAASPWESWSRSAPCSAIRRQAAHSRS